MENNLGTTIRTLRKVPPGEGGGTAPVPSTTGPSGGTGTASPSTIGPPGGGGGAAAAPSTTGPPGGGGGAAAAPSTTDLFPNYPSMGKCLYDISGHYIDIPDINIKKKQKTILDSKKITDFKKLKEGTLELNYSIFEDEILRLREASKRYIKWLLKIDGEHGINPDYFKSVLSLIFYSEQEKYSKIQGIFRPTRIEMSNTTQTIESKIEVTISDGKKAWLLKRFPRSFLSLIEELKREQVDKVIKGKKKKREREREREKEINNIYKIFFENKENLTIIKKDIPIYISKFFTNMPDYYTLLIKQPDLEISEFLLFPLKDIILFRGDTIKALNWRSEDNAKNSLRKLDLTSLTYDISKARVFATGLGKKTTEQFIQLVHLRSYVNNPYLIFIESISFYAEEFEVILPVDSIFNLINMRDKKIKNISVIYNNCFGLKDNNFTLEKHVELLQLSEEHRRETKLTDNRGKSGFFNRHNELPQKLIEIYLNPSVAIGKIKKIDSKKKVKSKIKNNKNLKKSKKSKKRKKRKN